METPAKTNQFKNFIFEALNFEVPTPDMTRAL
jgi:hypothetical protein